LTSGAVRDRFISTNIHYLLDPKDEKLHKVLEQTKEEGVTRLEATIYCGDIIPTREVMTELLDGMRKRMYAHSTMFKVPHHKLCSKLVESLKKSVIIDFPDLKRVYATIGYSRDTNKALGCSFKQKKIDAKNQAPYKAAVNHALNAIPPPDSDILYIRATFPE